MSRFAQSCVVVLIAALFAVPAFASSDAPDAPQPVIATGDFNGDGIPDLVKAVTPGDEASGPHSLTVLLGHADGTFTAAASYPLSGDPRAIVVGDFNGDGNLDAVVGNSNGAIFEFLGDGKGNLSNTGKIATVSSVASMATGHFTHGRHLDLVVSDSQANSAVILLGAGNGSFERTWSFSLPRAGREFYIAAADVNQDGISDLVIASDDDDNYEVMLGTGSGTFSYAPELSHVRDPNSYCPS